MDRCDHKLIVIKIHIMHTFTHFLEVGTRSRFLLPVVVLHFFTQITAFNFPLTSDLTPFIELEYFISFLWPQVSQC